MLTWLANLPPEARAHVESWGEDGLKDWLERVCIMLEDGQIPEGSAPWLAYVSECKRHMVDSKGAQASLFGRAA